MTAKRGGAAKVVVAADCVVSLEALEAASRAGSPGPLDTAAREMPQPDEPPLNPATG